jgi:hypothetical protein
LKDLLRNVLDKHSTTIQTVQLQRMRNYDDELQHFDHPNPPDAPRWAYVDQTDILYDTDIDKSTGDIDHDDFDGDDDYFDN